MSTSGPGEPTTVYTDGACSGNPGPGGWAWAVPSGAFASGAAVRTTNQRMEIQAALEAVASIPGPLVVVSDSTYVVNCFRDRWWQGWLARGWTNSQKKPVANRDLWQPLISLYRAEPDRIRFQWVKGHSGDPMNDLVDSLAVQAARTQQGRRGVNRRVGVDTGGTFTDVVTEEGRIAKVLSTPADPSRAVAAGMAEIGGGSVLAHGTTVATNALLERRGGVVAVVTSPGQRDLIEIARQARPSLYDQWADRPEPLVDRDRRLEATPGSPPVIPSGVDAVAVCLLHADLDPTAERDLETHLKDHYDVVCSSDASPEFREYERTVTTVVDAYLRKPCRRYLGALTELADQVLVLTSAGGLTPLDDAADHPARLLLSGPAGGVLAAARSAADTGFLSCVTFDMGGTSTDVCLVEDGRPEPAGQRTVAGLPVRLPSLDVHTIGAGGGSIARLDAGGALVVGPESAGSDPGPVCYGTGGTRPTVTDADLLCGRIPLAGLRGLGRLDRDASSRAMVDAGIDPAGVIAVVDQAMTQAVRAVSVERGVDPAQLALVAFGGAGPLHACAVAEALGMAAVLVPPRAGVLSAVGILGAPRQADTVRSCADPSDHRAARGLASQLEAAAARALGEWPVSSTRVAFDCRYRGQSHEMTVDDIDSFPAEHLRRSGYRLDEADVEVVAVRVSAQSESPVDISALPPVSRSGPVTGPASIAEPDCTIWVGEGWEATVHPSGSWVMVRAG